MKKQLLGFLLGAILASVCVGCGAKNTTTEPTETVEEITVAEESTPGQTIEEVTTPEEAESSVPTEESKPTDGSTQASATETQATEEPIEEVAPEKETAEATPQQTEEQASESVPQPVEEPSTDQAKLPATLPQALYTYTDMTATMYATQTVNVRNLPSTDGDKIGSLSGNQEVSVTGQCNETGWYMFDYNGTIAFVSNDYLVTEKPVAPAKTTSSGSMTRNAADYRQISSLSELTPSAGWTADFAGFCATYKSIPKVAYTYNGVTILLYDYTWSDDFGDWCVLYDFSRQNTTSPWSRHYQSTIPTLISDGGFQTYHNELDGSQVYTFHPISNFQVY